MVGMPRALSFLFILLCLPLAHASESSDSSFKDALQKRLSFVFNDEKLKKTSMGVEVYSLSRQESLFKLNADLPLSPASTIKLLTAATALKKLGPDFVYKTQVYADGPIQNGVLKGNLFIKASGDPSLVTERMYLLVDDIMRTELRAVTGNIVVDDWTFDQVKIDPKRIDSDTDRAYNAPVGALNFNYNTTTIYYRPGEKAGDRPRVFVEPDTGYIKIVNKAKTGKRGSGYKIVASRLKGDAGDTVLVKGSIPQGYGEMRSYFNITHPIVYAGQALKYMLAQRGIRVAGSEIKHAEVPPGAHLVATLDSLPLREIITLMNKFSNNFIAETLVKTLGREIKGVPGTMEKGLQVLTEEATKMGINQAGFNLVSGSGLTRDNRITASQFIALLNNVYLDFDILPELLSSMPIAGKDGTLRSRMKGTSAYGRLRGKTGTLDGVSTIVGVVQSRGGELLAFAVLMNDKSQGPGALKSWQNYFAQALADFNRKTLMQEKPSPLPDVIEAPDSQADEGAPIGGR
jgi:D-alanyl-D-alanine carboxypeptidase/D-alanyl-D-alanine-endopeptidase (penicillin-binding protein 4)